MPERRPLIFVSSQFAEFETFRKAALDALLVVGAIPVTLEHLAATTRTIDEIVEKSIEESDAVLLVVGHRYGSIRTETGVSWQEMEYRIAERGAKPLLVFLAAKDTPWPPALIDADRTMVEAFRQRLASHHAVKTFSSPSELRALVMQAVSSWIAAIQRAPSVELTSAPDNLHEIRVIRLLLSSPGDVSEERDRAAQAVFRFNQDAVEENGLFIKLVRWEDMAPQIGPKAQTVINKQIGYYHMFCGIMWNRFGTPTDIAASGTKEEFDGAANCWRAERRPWITFYFCDRPASFTTPEQLDQKRLVLEFRAKLNDMGVVRSFQTPQDFEDRLYEDLKRIARTPEFLKMLSGK